MPYIIVRANPFACNPVWKTEVGDKDSDPKLMALLDAVLDIPIDKTYNRFYKTSLSPRQVLDRLEDEGYKIVGVQPLLGFSMLCWTLHKSHMIPLYDFPIDKRITGM